MEDTASSIVKTRRYAHGWIDELEELEADAVTSGKERDFNFLEPVVVDAEDWCIGIGASRGAARSVFKFSEAKDCGVKLNSCVDVRHVDGDVVYDPVVGETCYLQ